MSDGDKDPDWVFQNHPDLIDNGWAKKEAKAARKRAKKYWAAETGQSRPRGPYRRLRVIVAVAVVVGAGIFVVSHPWTNQEVANVFAPVRAGATPTVRQTARPLDLNAPFGNTPAAGWSDGAAGIQPPAATAVGRYSAAQVTTALNAVKQLLVVSHLDPKMLVNHDTSTYLSMMAPLARDQEQKDLADPKYTQDRSGGLSMLAPGFHLLPVSVKVNGTMSVAVGSDGELVVHTNYVFAFPFAPSDPSTITKPWEIVAIQHVTEDYEYVADPKMTAASQGLYVRNVQAYYDSIECTESKQGLLAPAYANPPAVGAPNTDPYAYYDPNHALDIPNSC